MTTRETPLCSSMVVQVAMVALFSASGASAGQTSAATYNRVEVAPFEVASGVLFPEEFSQALAKELLAELKKANLFNEVLTVQSLPADNLALTVRLIGTITKFNPGSQARRHLIGLGAGTTRIDARVRFLDRRTCAVVLEADVDGKVVGGWGGGDSFGAARGVAKEVVQIARRMRREVLRDAPVTCAAANAPPMPAVASTLGAATSEVAPERTHEPDLEQRLLARYKSLSSEQIAELETNAAAGTPEAQFLLGHAFIEGVLVPKDVEKGLTLYRQAGEQNFRAAQTALGDRYFAGNVVTRDYAEAFKWYSKAAAQGSPAAQSNLGVMYLEGRGQRRDPTLAAGWFTSAADQGNAIAQRMLAGLYAAGTGVAKNDGEAMKWYTRAAEGGDSAAQVELGFRYTRGWGVPIDDAEAVKWLQRAAAQGSADAFMFLGVRHEHGRGVAKAPEQSVRYFRQAAEGGQIIGMCYLGDMYLWGRGVAQSDREAYRWYLTSAAAGNKSCEANLKNAGRRLNPQEREAAERDAREWAKRSSR
jgi:TPR repeat protein